MSTLAIPFRHRSSVAADLVKPESQNLESAEGHNGELAFRRHVVAVYMGYMGATILIASFYMLFVWAYFQLR